jgi:hypothetical protein
VSSEVGEGFGLRWGMLLSEVERGPIRKEVSNRIVGK